MIICASQDRIVAVPNDYVLNDNLIFTLKKVVNLVKYKITTIIIKYHISRYYFHI